MTATQKKSYCRICISNCGLIVDVDGEDVVQVRRLQYPRRIHPI